MRNILKIGIPKVAYHELTFMVCNLCQPQKTITNKCVSHVKNHHFDEIFQSLPIELITQKRHCCLNEIGISVSKFVCHHAEDHGPIIIETAGSFCSLIQTRLILVSGSIGKGLIMQTISKEQLTNFERGNENVYIPKYDVQMVNKMLFLWRPILLFRI